MLEKTAENTIDRQENQWMIINKKFSLKEQMSSSNLDTLCKDLLFRQVYKARKVIVATAGPEGPGQRQIILSEI